MRIPISSIFFDFNENLLTDNNFDLTRYPLLEFMPINIKKFPAIKIGYQVMKMGGLAPHVFNYLNELLVNLFIEKKITFTDIVKYNELNLERVFKKIKILQIQN